MGYADELFDLTGRVVLITGGSRGLGREMAFAAARLRRRRRHRQPQPRLLRGRPPRRSSAATGRAAFPYQVHVGRWDQLDGLVDAAYDRFGKVDVLVNNAGMSPLYESLASVTEKLFDAVVNLNLKGPFRLSALVGERMVADGGGSIINVSSSGSLRPAPDMLPYAAAKAGLNALTEGLAQAFGPTVRVNTLMAGPVPHRHQQGVGPRRRPGRPFGTSPLQRAGQPARDRRRRTVSRVGRVELSPRGRICASTAAMP